MTPEDPDEIFERAIAALASSAEDALSKAVAEGLPDRTEVVDWVERCKRLVLVERDRSALRSEVPALADRLRRLLAQVTLRGGASPDGVVLRFVDLLLRGAIGLAFHASWYALLFHLENLLVLVPAALILGNRTFRVTPRAVFISSIVTALGGMLYRFTPTTIAYRAGTTSIYFPTVAELLMMLGYMGLAVVLFIWAAKRFEIIPAPAEEWVASMEYEKKLTSDLRTNEYGAATGY